MSINKMEFQWHLNWWYRPTQLDGLGTSVADYYDCFCDWKANMELNLCPADEADYVAAFIQNLKSNIRLRLESKGRLSMRSLRDVVSDAKFEECMILMEHARKEIEARLMFDKMPSRLPTNNQVFPMSSHSLSSSEDSYKAKAVENSWSSSSLGSSALPASSSYSSSGGNSLVIEDNESSGLEDGESLQMELEKETHKMFDNLPEQNLCESSSIDQESIGDYDSELNSQETTSNQDIGDSEAQSFALETLSWLFEEDEHSPPSKLEGMGNAHHSLDESPTEHSLDQTKGYPLDPVPHGCDVWQSPFLIVRSVLLDKTPQQVLTSLQAIPEDSKSPFLGEGCNSATKLGVVKVACKMFDEMPRQFFFEPNEKINGDMDSITQIDCVPRVFDPGTSIIGGDLGAAATLNMPLPSFWMNNEVIQPSTIQTAKYKMIENVLFLSNFELWVGNVLFLFDPGGCVSKLSIRLSLTPIMVSAVFRNDGLAADEMAKQPLAQCSQASIVFSKWQIIGLSETEMDCYTFIIIVGNFVWDPGTNLVVPFTSLRTMMFLRGMEEYSGIDVQNGTHKVLAKLSGLVLEEGLIDCSIFSLDSDEGLDALSCEEVVFGVSFTNFSSMSKLEFDPQVFDPGIDIHLRKEFVNQLNANEGRQTRYKQGFILAESSCVAHAQALQQLRLQLMCKFKMKCSQMILLIFWHGNGKKLSLDLFAIILEECNTLTNGRVEDYN